MNILVILSSPVSDVAIGPCIMASLFRIGACESAEIALKGDVVRGGGSRTSPPFIRDGRWAAGQPRRQSTRCVNAVWGDFEEEMGQSDGRTLRLTQLGVMTTKTKVTVSDLSITLSFELRRILVMQHLTTTKLFLT